MTAPTPTLSTIPARPMPISATSRWNPSRSTEDDPLTEVAVDHDHGLDGPPESDCALAQSVLTLGALLILKTWRTVDCRT